MKEDIDVINDQATINIGTIGHVAHGKSTIVRAISGISTIKFKAELERNITIKLGYANAKIYKCEGKCKRPDCYQAFNSSSPSKLICKICNGSLVLVRHVSFVDCPGHDVLMATMLSGTAIMDAAFLLIAANEPCPQPQTTEHLCAVEVMNLKKIIIVQNKIDLISREQALEQYDQILNFLKKSNASGPVIPTAAQLGVNISAILDFIVNYVPEPKRNEEENPKMIIIRSFDVNRPGTGIEELNGGVIGGSLVTGVVKLGDEVEIRPGMITKKGKDFICQPFVTKVVSLKAENNILEQAYPGGLIGVGTEIDPSFCKSDRLVGQVMGLIGKLPPIRTDLIVDYELFQKTMTQDKQDLRVNDHVQLNIGSTITGGIVKDLEKDKCTLELIKPTCCDINERIAISRKINNHWRLIGHGLIVGGNEIEPVYS